MRPRDGPVTPRRFLPSGSVRNRLGDSSTPPAVRRTDWAPVVAIGLAMLVVTSEANVVAVALPDIGADLGIDAATTAWVLLAYALPVAALAIPAGRWIDRADPRLALVASMIGIGVTSVVAALAPTLWLLLVARLLQGIAGTLTLAGYLPVIAATVREDQRGRAIAVVVTLMTIGGLAGTALGGLVAGALSWRAVFLMKLPLLAVVLWLSARAFSRDGRGLPRPGGDLLGEAVVLGGAIAAVLVAVDEVSRRPVVAAALGVVAVVLGVLWARMPGARPVISLVRERRFGFTLAGLFLVCCNGGLMLFLVPYLTAEVLHRGPEVTGFLLLLHIGAVSAFSPVSGWLADRWGPHRVAVLGGVLTTGTSLVPLTLGAEAGLFDVGWQLALIGAGFGLFNSPIITAVMAAAPPGAAGTAGGVSGTARMVALTVAPAVTALCWSATGGGLVGFRSGVLALVTLQALGVLALLAVRPPRGPAARAAHPRR